MLLSKILLWNNDKKIIDNSVFITSHELPNQEPKDVIERVMMGGSGVDVYKMK